MKVRAIFWGRKKGFFSVITSAQCVDMEVNVSSMSDGIRIVEERLGEMYDNISSLRIIVQEDK